MHDVSNRDNIQIYRFFPHGSKKLSDLSLLEPLNDYVSLLTKIQMVCHDQEPLNFDLYNYLDNNSVFSVSDYQKAYQDPTIAILLTASDEYKKLLLSMNVAQVVSPIFNLNDNVLLLHSELNSEELKKYESGNFIGVYYWSHALIARDWFRYAQIDPVLSATDNTLAKTDFLIYNRSWSGTREYRIKFADLLVQANLLSFCNTKFNAYDVDKHYQNHDFVNNNFIPARFDLENFFDSNNFSSTASADYAAKDYCNSSIEVVLETLFDDKRNHLTEKTLRPIACGHPFILAATPRSLQYLQNYGFKTFSPYINETYDNIEDPLLRLNSIVTEMKRIANLSDKEKTNLYSKLNEISKFNQERFFSQDFFNLIVSEYKNNLNQALEILSPKRLGTKWKHLRKYMYQTYPDQRSYLINSHVYTKQDVINSHLWIKNPPKL